MTATVVEPTVSPPPATPAGGNPPVVAFFGLACALSWAYWVPMALSGSSVERGDGWPTQLPGLLGPMLAAFVVVSCTEGAAGVRALLASMVRRPGGTRALLAMTAPLAFLAVALGVAVAVGDAPAGSDFLRYSGTSAAAVALVAALVVTGFGEETGWRGYALARLQRRHGPVRATLAVTAGWAIWHIPLFFILASYADFSPLMAVGWLIGLTAGSFVLTAVFNLSGGSVLAVVVWHASYNAGAGSDAGDGLVAPIMTACVIFWAVSLVQRHRRGLPAFGSGPPAVSRTTSKHLATRGHALVYRLSGGRLLGRMGGQPVLLLQTVGRHTGQTHSTPLQYLPADGRFVVVAAAHGAARPPGWSLNLRAAPHARVRIGARRVNVAAREVHHAERDALWQQLTSANHYLDRAARKAGRRLPVFALTEEGPPRQGRTTVPVGWKSRMTGPGGASRIRR